MFVTCRLNEHQQRLEKETVLLVLCVTLLLLAVTINTQENSAVIHGTIDHFGG